MRPLNLRKARIPANSVPEGGDMPNALQSEPPREHPESIPSRPLSQILESYTPYLFYACRLQSFTTQWPHTNENLSPDKMARAGFFYSPDASGDDIDNVACPFCLKELTGWEPDDDPIIEHSKRKEGCYFIQLGKCEIDFTVGDFVLLLAQRHASLMDRAYVSFVESMEASFERTSALMRKQSDALKKPRRCNSSRKRQGSRRRKK